MLHLQPDAVLITLLFLFFVAGCASSKSDTPTEALLQKVATDHFGDDAEILPNKSNTHALIRTVSPTVQAPQHNTVHFLIYSIEAEDIVLEDTAVRGNVEWIDDENVEVTRVPGIDRGTGDGLTGYVFNIYTGQKHSRK